MLLLYLQQNINAFHANKQHIFPVLFVTFSCELKSLVILSVNILNFNTSIYINKNLLCKYCWKLPGEYIDWNVPKTSNRGYANVEISFVKNKFLRISLKPTSKDFLLNIQILYNIFYIKKESFSYCCESKLWKL